MIDLKAEGKTAAELLQKGFSVQELYPTFSQSEIVSAETDASWTLPDTYASEKSALDASLGPSNAGNGGVIAGIVVGIILVIAAIVGTIFLWNRQSVPSSTAYLPSTTANPVYDVAASNNVAIVDETAPDEQLFVSFDDIFDSDGDSDVSL